jgi:mRNA interferase MazF
MSSSPPSRRSPIRSKPEGSPVRTYRRCDVWLANLDPVIGSEQGRTRPVVIIQNDVANEYSPVVIVAAVTTALGPKEYPTEVRVRAPEGGLKKDSVVLLNQIRTIDKRRLVERWGPLRPETTKRLDEALRISLGLVPI